MRDETKNTRVTLLQENVQLHLPKGSLNASHYGGGNKNMLKFGKLIKDFYLKMHVHVKIEGYFPYFLCIVVIYLTVTVKT